MRTGQACLVIALALGHASSAAQHRGHEDLPRSSTKEHFEFASPIKRVAVIGAGAAGVQHANALVNEGFKVRLFERREQPGGVWLYSPSKPIPASFPDAPLREAAYVPDIPDSLPLRRIIKDGTDGITNDYRLREHSSPSVIWKNYGLVIPPRIMPLPTVVYQDGIFTPHSKPWGANRVYAGQKLREYITSIGFNSNDNENTNVTVWSTRVERVHKAEGSSKWTLTLRKLVRLPYTARSDGENDDLLVEYWNEEFDAVVVGLVGESDAPHVPDIPGLAAWAHRFPESVYHVREYRIPEPLANKNVLIIGDYLSAQSVASDLAPHAASITLSYRKRPEDLTPFQTAALTHRLPKNVTTIGGIHSFSNITNESTDIAKAGVRLENGTSLAGFDQVILATGYRTSFPFLAEFHNSTIKGFKEPEVEREPIVTDGTHFRSLHWTGHYIPDPTLALAQVDPYTLGRFQSEGFARVWSGRARLPTQQQMWAEYPGAGKEMRFHPTDASVASGARLFVTWLNDEILEYGGRLVDGLRNGNEEGLTHYMASEWPGVKIGNKVFRGVEDTPRSQWPVRTGREGQNAYDEFGETGSSAYGIGRLW